MNVIGQSPGLWKCQNETPTESPSVTSNFSDFSRIPFCNMNRKSGWTYSMIRGRLDIDFQVLITFPKNMIPWNLGLFFNYHFQRHFGGPTPSWKNTIRSCPDWCPQFLDPPRVLTNGKKWPKTLRCFNFFVGNGCWDVGMFAPLFETYPW